MLGIPRRFINFTSRLFIHTSFPSLFFQFNIRRDYRQSYLPSSSPLGILGFHKPSWRCATCGRAPHPAISDQSHYSYQVIIDFKVSSGAAYISSAMCFASAMSHQSPPMIFDWSGFSVEVQDRGQNIRSSLFESPFNGCPFNLFRHAFWPLHSMSYLTRQPPLFPLGLQVQNRILRSKDSYNSR